MPELAVPGGWVVALVAGLAFAALVAFEVHRGTRGWLLGLRIATAMAGWLLCVQPRWVVERIDEREGRVTVLVDGSRSMEVGDRAQTVRALLDRWEGDSDEATLQRFGSLLEPASWQDLDAAVRPRDDETRLAAALESLVEADVGERLGAVVVVSDGAESDEIDPAFVAAESLRGVRVHTVSVGADEQLRDDALVSLEGDRVGFLRRPAQVRVGLRVSGGGDRNIPVTLYEGNEVVAEQVAHVAEGETTTVVLPFVPRRLGRGVYRVAIPVEADDDVPANNERAFLIHVQRDKLRVLLVAGHPTWDVRFLRSFLERDPGIDLISFFILRTTSDLTMAPPDELALIPFPTDELFREHLGSFDVVVFQDFDYGPYQMASYLPRIRAYVERGGSFAMVGGEKSFASGGYADTPIADILPVDLPRIDDPQPGLDERLVTLGSYAPEVDAERIRHPLVALGADPTATASAWARLAPLEGANLVDGVRAGAQVLLSHPRARARRGGKLPLLVTGTFGQGRVLALTTDTSWRWGLPSGGVSGDATAHERFWDRSLRWLSRDPSLEPAHVTTDRERYGPEATVRVRAHLRDARYQPLSLRSVRLALLDAAGAETSGADVVLDAEGQAEVELLGPTAAGAYRAVALDLSPSAAQEQHIAEQWFVVESGGEELADPRARPDRLQAWSEATGGSSHRASDAPSLDSFDATRTEHLGTVSRAPFASPWMLPLVAAIFSLEWWVRRRAGAR